MSDMYKDIKEFHKRFQLDPSNPEPHLLDSELLRFRADFMLEEFQEFLNACRENNLHDAFDALIDLSYVTLGTAYLMSLPFDQGWDEVHRANMAKTRAIDLLNMPNLPDAIRQSLEKRNSKYDVVKPPGWVKPDLTKFITKVL